jgi:putative transposase
MIQMMSVYRRFSGHGLPYFVTSNTDRRSSLFTDPRAVSLLMQVVKEVRAQTGLRIHAYVVMPDHVHFVLGLSPRETVSRVMELIKGRFAHRWNRRTGGKGSVWQSRFNERALRTDDALRSAIDYVHMNPVEAGLVERPEDYQWSSSGWWHRRSEEPEVSTSGQDESFHRVHARAV